MSHASFDIEVRFLGGLTGSQQEAFTEAAERWEEVIAGDLPDVLVGSELVDDLVIFASGDALDGPDGTLGAAAPTVSRPAGLGEASGLPAAGRMVFDTADLAGLEEAGLLDDAVTHEMGHVLGFGTIWDELGLRQGTGTANPTFTGPSAMREFATLSGGAATRAVPLANVGGPGTRDGHWRESVFGNELMTGFLNEGPNPLSRLTIAALEDMGYEVSYASADPFALPTALDLAMLGIGAGIGDHGGRGIMLVPPHTVLPQSALA